MIELYLMIRYFILKPLGLVKGDPEHGNENKKEWLDSIGYYDYLKEQKHKKKQ